MTKDYYKILGVDKKSDKEDIKRAFRKLSKEYHPDLGGDAEKFKEINEAYSVLSNDEKRSQYDNPSMAFDGSSIFNDFFSNFGFNFHEDGFSRRQRRSPGQNLQFEMKVTLYEAICGGEREIEYIIKERCDECNGLGGFDKEVCDVCQGTGFITHANMSNNVHIVNKTTCRKCFGKGYILKNKCEKCNGTGFIDVNKNITISLPKNIKEGTQIRISGAGYAGDEGLPSGDLFIRFHIEMPKKENLTDEQLEILRGISEKNIRN
jgi:molecular chaperone DnaJ